MIPAELKDSYSWSADLHKEKEKTENIWCEWQERSNLACIKLYAKSHNLVLYISKHIELLHFENLANVYLQLNRNSTKYLIAITSGIWIQMD